MLIYTVMLRYTHEILNKYSDEHKKEMTTFPKIYSPTSLLIQEEYHECHRIQDFSIKRLTHVSTCIHRYNQVYKNSALKFPLLCKHCNGYNSREGKAVKNPTF